MLSVMNLSHQSCGSNIASKTSRENRREARRKARRENRREASREARCEDRGITGLTLVSDLSYEPSLSLHLVLYSLKPAVR